MWTFFWSLRSHKIVTNHLFGEVLYFLWGLAYFYTTFKPTSESTFSSTPGMNLSFQDKSSSWI
jgi:hypothetical protein